MLQKFEIAGVHYHLDERVRAYVTEKLGGLDRYIPRHGRDSAHLEIRLKEAKVGRRVQCVCEVTLHLPQETINLTESGLTMFAAVDVVKAKLKERIKRYKDEFADGGARRHLFARLGRRFSRQSVSL